MDYGDGSGTNNVCCAQGNEVMIESDAVSLMNEVKGDIWYGQQGHLIAMQKTTFDR